VKLLLLENTLNRYLAFEYKLKYLTMLSVCSVLVSVCSDYGNTFLALTALFSGVIMTVFVPLVKIIKIGRHKFLKN
jgi:hypothetical protein